MKKYKALSIILFLLLPFVACIDDDEGSDVPDFPEPNLGTVQANRVKLTIYPTGTTNQEVTYEFYDADGVGGAEPTVNEEITLKYPSGGASDLAYESSIQFFNDNTEVTEQIENLGTQYVICYRNTDTRNLRLSERNNDSNNKPLGLTAEWFTRDDRGLVNPGDGTGEIFITLNFQESGKDGSCDAGFRIFEGTMNYRLN